MIDVQVEPVPKQDHPQQGTPDSVKHRCSGVSLSLLAAALAATLASGPIQDDTLFHYTDGWLGADAAYSVPLDPFSTVWLFGDTFVGKHRKPETMIHNSIAIRKCTGGCQVTYWWSGMHKGKQDSFFRTAESDYYWPLDGFLYQGKLYLFLEQMHATGDGGAFGFDYTSVKLATVSNMRAAPEEWQISYRTLSIGNRVVAGIAAAIPDEAGKKYAYVFTLFRKSASEPFVGLMRFPLEDLASDSISAPWQYLAGRSTWRNWSPSTSPLDAFKVLSGNITEMSVKYHPETRQWIAVYPTPGFSNTASYSQASDLSGPWRQPRPLFTYPEMDKSNPHYTPNVFCYAAKEHPELESRDQIAFTYACNSLKEEEIFRDIGLYRPELVRLPWPTD
jgi:hypothetical protein